MKVLIAEDDLTSRSILVGLLKKHGYDVVPMEDGADAWRAMQQPDAPPLAILDWMMPKMNGLKVVRKIRARQGDRPPYIIMLTSKGEKGDIVAGLEAGANDYLIKPFDSTELLARIGVGVRMIGLQEQLSAQLLELRHALDHIKTLQGILPICSFCKKIRNDQGYWDQVDVYIGKHSNAKFSHSVCSECMKKHYPEAFYDDGLDAEGKDNV